MSPLEALQEVERGHLNEFADDDLVLMVQVLDREWREALWDPEATTQYRADLEAAQLTVEREIERRKV